MKFTDEMHEVLRAALKEAYGTDSTLIVSTADISCFLAGYRMGLRDMRERAAERCERARGKGITREAQEHNETCDILAEAIRDLENTNG